MKERQRKQGIEDITDEKINDNFRLSSKSQWTLNKNRVKKSKLFPVFSPCSIIKILWCHPYKFLFFFFSWTSLRYVEFRKGKDHLFPFHSLTTLFLYQTTEFLGIQSFHITGFSTDFHPTVFPKETLVCLSSIDSALSSCAVSFFYPRMFIQQWQLYFLFLNY